LVRRRRRGQGLQPVTQGSRLLQGGPYLPFEGRVFLGLLSAANAAAGEQSRQDKDARDAVAHGGLLERTGLSGLLFGLRGWVTRGEPHPGGSAPGVISEPPTPLDKGDAGGRPDEALAGVEPDGAVRSGSGSVIVEDRAQAAVLGEEGVAAEAEQVEVEGL